MDSRNAAVEPLPLVPAMWRWGKRGRGGEALAEDGDVFEIELCGRGLGRSGQFAAEGKQVADRGFVFHFISAQKEVEGAGDEGL